jgi:hypothetical protein
MPGAFATLTTCITIIGIILNTSKRLNDIYFIKSLRPKMRHLNVLMQISMLLAFL